MRFVLVALLVVVGLGLFPNSEVFASTATPTPSPTPTATPTPTLTPDVNQYLILPAVTDEAGMQVKPAQDFAFGFAFNSGDVVIAVELALLVFSVWMVSIILALLSRKG